MNPSGLNSTENSSNSIQPIQPTAEQRQRTEQIQDHSWKPPVGSGRKIQPLDYQRELIVRKVEDLVHAIRAGSFEKAKALVETGVNVNIMAYGIYGGDYPPFPLYSAATQGVKYTKLLLDAGALVNFGVRDNMTALRAAILHGNLETVELLIEHGANVNAPGWENKMPLEQLRANDPEFEAKKALLLKHGATTVLANKSGLSEFTLPPRFLLY